MKLNKVLFGVLPVAIAVSVIAAEPAPVIDYSNKNSSGSMSVNDVESLVRQLESLKKARLKDQQLLNELLDEVSELRGVTELHSHQITQILERQRELYQELDRRVSQALKPASNLVPHTLAAPTTATTVNYSSNLTENEAYDNAVNLVLKEKQYDKAIPAFKAFNQQFPNSSYAANAHYWLGQLLFNKGELAEAKTAFDVVVSRFINSSKRSDALLKLGMIAQKQGDNSQAVQLYRQLLADYPDSSAAKLAQPRLSSISQ